MYIELGNRISIKKFFVFSLRQTIPVTDNNKNKDTENLMTRCFTGWHSWAQLTNNVASANR